MEDVVIENRTQMIQWLEEVEEHLKKVEKDSIKYHQLMYSKNYLERKIRIIDGEY